MADDTSTQDVLAAFGITRPTIGRRAEIARAAIAAGHRPDVQLRGKRVKFLCDCGFSTPASWTLKHSKEAAIDHMIRAGRTALGETPLLGEIPPVNGVSQPAQKPSALEDASNVVIRASR